MKFTPYQLQIILLVLSYAFPAIFGLVPWYVLWAPLWAPVIFALLEKLVGLSK